MKHLRYRNIEKITKAVANHRRIQILNLLSQDSDLSVLDISNQTQANLKTIDVHINRLFFVGLINKRTVGRRVLHTITPLGKSILTFLRKLE